MTTVNREASGSWSASASASSGFDWMTPGLWDVPIPPPPPPEARLRDLGVCDECVADVFDSANRRHGYPFTSCGNCGPRHSILLKMPFARENTTMAGFTMCEACQREVDDPRDRRFGYEANCCPWCGPALRAVGPGGEALGSSEPHILAARALRAQLTVSLKGSGDYHLICDATSATAVARLRDRSGLRDVPLTVMVRDLDEAKRTARLTQREISLLTSVERPVVLVSIRTDSPLTGEVAAGNQLAGLLLPYTPLHHLLLSESGRPLVFAPAGVPDSTLLAGNSAAMSELRGAADIFLLHDRPVAARDDDSVARVVDDRVSIEHRSRGITPVPIRLHQPLERPVVGIGAGPSRTVCFAAGDTAGMEPFLPGDDASAESIDRTLQRAHDLFGLEPRVVAVDSLDDERVEMPASLKPITVVPVQHHHAHYASCMAENGLSGNVLAVVYDGGSPGISDLQWGGEIFIGGYESYERIATFRPLALPGAKAVRRQAWTAALALLDDAFDGEPPLHAIPMFRNMPRRGIDVVRRLRNRSTCLTSGAQVYLDALAAIVLNKAEAPIDGSLAREFDVLASDKVSGHYPVVIRDGANPWEIDLRALARRATLDFIGGVAHSAIAARVRNTVVEFTVEVLLAYGGGAGEMPVVLTGDLFERTSLAGPIRARLGRDARVFTHSGVPAGDEGLGLGQVVIADSQMKRNGFPSVSRPPVHTTR